MVEVSSLVGSGAVGEALACISVGVLVPGSETDAGVGVAVADCVAVEAGKSCVTEGSVSVAFPHPLIQPLRAKNRIKQTKSLCFICLTAPPEAE